MSQGSGRVAPVLLAFVLFLPSCGDNAKAPATSPSSTSAVVVSAEVEQQIVKFCGLCHAMPRPESFPKGAWDQEVKQGFEFYHKSGRSDVTPPNMQATVEYFRSRAPEMFEFALGPPASSELASRRFRLDETRRPTFARRMKPPAISFVKELRIGSDDRPALLLSDMAQGGVHVWRPLDEAASLETLGPVSHPAGACVCDLDGNGLQDVIVSDLGTFFPSDHNLGRVVWLRDALAGIPKNDPVVLLKSVGRVADVQAADLDGDGDLDLVVAEFGWRTTGRVLWMQNNGPAESPNFEVKVLDPRHGAIHVPIVDLNRDGRPDVVALLAQEHESVEVFLNRGAGEFEKQNLYTAGDPSFGSSGIQIVDLDRDGDDDVLYTNGDMFDSQIVKPYYGVQWLENRGSYPFEAHHLATLPGIHRALAGDIDNDGDLDVVACAVWPRGLRKNGFMRGFDSVIWLEQTEPSHFRRHAIETGRCTHASMELSDLDQDGDLDITTGEFYERGDNTAPQAIIWWNEPR